MTQDFFLGQLRLIAVAVIAFCAGKGWLSTDTTTLMGTLLAPVGLLFGPWAWSIYSNFNRKLVPHDAPASNVAGKVAMLLLTAIALNLFMVAAYAADNIPLKAAPKAAVVAAVAIPCDITGCTGPYAGATFSGSGTGVNIANLGSLNAGGSYLGGSFGYQYYAGNYYLGVRAITEYEVANPPGAIIAGLSNKLFAFAGVELGGNLNNVLTISTSGNFPAIFQNMVPTILVGGCWHGPMSGECTGIGGHIFVPKSRWTVDAIYLNAQYNAGTKLAPGVTGNTENRGTLGLSYHF